MTHGSLFSGIGGFDLAAHWMGWTNVFNCEIDPFCQRILKHHFPNSTQYGDISKVDFRHHRGGIDILSGGFPCQPYSTAGKRLGKADDRHLWPQMCRAIREIRPRWIVGENVFGLLNWNEGVVFEEVSVDLEDEGYEVQSFVLPSCGINAPHIRRRVFIIAHSVNCPSGGESRGVSRETTETDGGREESNPASEQQVQLSSLPSSSLGFATNPDIGSGTTDAISTRREELDELYGLPRDAPDSEPTGFQVGTNSRGLSQEERDVEGERRESPTQPQPGGQQSPPNSRRGRRQDSIYGNESRGETNQPGNGGSELGDWWQNFPTESPICGGDDGIPAELDDITLSKWRNESIKGYGNAVVPPLILQIFKTIEEYEAN